MNCKTCFECGCELEHCRNYSELDPNIGRIRTDGDYWHCPNCGCDEVPFLTARKVDEARQTAIQRLLWKGILNADDFDSQYVGVKELAQILNVSRQAIDKSGTLKNIIYNVSIKGIRYWNRKSAEQYRKTGDGRFPLICIGRKAHPNAISLRAKSRRKPCHQVETAIP